MVASAAKLRRFDLQCQMRFRSARMKQTVSKVLNQAALGSRAMQEQTLQ
jgi:hypothetical protein